jgi:CRISPR/Cas system-associated exonuclease Cas4 (RecB family)
MPQPALTLSRRGLTDFLACQRRFQLRYQQRLAWPPPPIEPAQKERMALGERFHQLVERHYLRLPILAQDLDTQEGVLSQWWAVFLRHAPAVGGAMRVLPEATVQVPALVTGDTLLGRFDLLVVTAVGELHLYDWKTGKPRTSEALAADWQTRLYLALAAQSGAALGVPDLVPEQVRLTYWYVQEPEQPRVLGYDTASHQQNWAEIQQLISQIANLPSKTSWPMTPDESLCAACLYQTYCGRTTTNQLIADILEEREFWEDTLQEVEPLEPEWG